MEFYLHFAFLIAIFNSSIASLTEYPWRSITFLLLFFAGDWKWLKLIYKQYSKYDIKDMHVLQLPADNYVF